MWRRSTETVSSEVGPTLLPGPHCLIGSTGSHHSLDVSLSGVRHVQVVCVSTERNGQIDSSSLGDVCRNIASVPSAPRPLFLVIDINNLSCVAWFRCQAALSESGWQLGRDIHIGCSPRRDWYIGDVHTIRTVPKISGGSNALWTEIMSGSMAASAVNC